MDKEFANVILEDIIDVFEELTEEVENLYGKETLLTIKARKILDYIEVEQKVE